MDGIMQGWITKVSIVVGLIGSACLAGAQVAPKPEWGPWLNFFGVVLGSIGGAGAAVGISRKVEKGPVTDAGQAIITKGMVVKEKKGGKS